MASGEGGSITGNGENPKTSSFTSRTMPDRVIGFQFSGRTDTVPVTSSLISRMKERADGTISTPT
jgi:hypothetical protein